MFWVNVCWMSLLLWGGSVWKVTTSSASRKRINITNSVCVSYTNRNKLVKNKNIFSFYVYPKAIFCCQKKLTNKIKQPWSLFQEKVYQTDIAVFHTPCLERMSNSISMSGQCCGHSRLIISTTIRDRASLIWFSSSKMFNVPWKRTRDIKRYARRDSRIQKKAGL